MEPLEQQQNTETLRAKEIDTGAIPLSMENIMLGLPQKPVENRSFSSAIAPQWTYEELQSQCKLVKTLAINTSTTGEIWSFKHTWRNVEQLHFRTLTNLFLLRSWKLNFIFEFRSNFQHVGLMNIVFNNMPLALHDYIPGKQHVDSFPLQVQLPHRLVSMGEDVNVHIGLNWLSPFIAAPSKLYKTNEPANLLYDDYDMGTLKLYVPYPMEVATGVVENMSVRIWSYLSDVTYAGYNISDSII